MTKKPLYKQMVDIRNSRGSKFSILKPVSINILLSQVDFAFSEEIYRKDQDLYRNICIKFSSIKQVEYAISERSAGNVYTVSIVNIKKAKQTDVHFVTNDLLFVLDFLAKLTLFGVRKVKFNPYHTNIRI